MSTLFVRFVLQQLLAGFKLRDHPLDLCQLRPSSLVPELLKRIHVFSLQGFFARLVDQTTLHPHLDTLPWLQVGAFGDKGGGKTSVASAKHFVVEGLHIRQHWKQALVRVSNLPPSRSAIFAPCQSLRLRPTILQQPRHEVEPTTMSFRAP